jgi:GLPGLI family protein
MKAVVKILAFALCFGNFSVNAQQSIEAQYECIYEYNVNGENKSGEHFSETYNGILQIGRKNAKFQDYTSFQIDSVKSINADEDVLKNYTVQAIKNEFFFDQTIYQNFPKGQMSTASVVTPNYYTYEESRNPINWTLQEVCDTICGYACLRAQGEYGGRQWTAWYAPEIPVQFGPWKLTGLPGLILAASDSDGIHSFKAISFRKASTPIDMQITPNAVSTTREKFIKLKNKFEEDQLKNIPVESISEMTIQKHGDGPRSSSAFINGVQLRLRTNRYIPLEIN